MYKAIILLFPILYNSFLYSQNDALYQYHPKSFEESLIHLDKLFDDSEKSAISNTPEEEFITNTHFSIGRWIRNEWLYNRYLFGLIVKKSELKKDLESKGLFHNDDMSSFILRSYHRHLTKKDLKIQEQLNNIYQFHLNMNDTNYIKEQNKLFWSKIISQFSIGDTLSYHLYYDRNWLGTPRKNTIIKGVVLDKSDNQIKINLFNYGDEQKERLIFEELNCDSSITWINPMRWTIIGKK